MVFGRGDGGCLVARPCLTFNAKDNLQANWIENTHGVRLAPTTHFLPTGEAFAIAAQIGLGWGIMPEPLARAPITSGALVSLVTDTDLDVEFEWQATCNILIELTLNALTSFLILGNLLFFF